MRTPSLAGIACLTSLLLATSVLADAEPPVEPPADPPAKRRRHYWPRPAAGPSSSGSPEVLFTFDDGPHELYTAPILDTLRKHDIQAVFFWAGWRLQPGRKFGPQRRALVARALAEGHLVGNHTVNHVHLCGVSKGVAARELDVSTAMLEELAGMPVTWMRAPYGNKCPRLDEQIAERGLWHLHWDMDPMEWVHWSSAQTRDYLIKKIQKLDDGERGVILLHDTHPQGARAFPQVLAWIAKENVRREAQGRPPIKIISYADVARDRLDAGVDDLVTATQAALLDFLPTLVDDLLLPVAPRAGGAALTNL